MQLAPPPSRATVEIVPVELIFEGVPTNRKFNSMLETIAVIAIFTGVLVSWRA